MCVSSQKQQRQTTKTYQEITYIFGAKGEPDLPRIMIQFEDAVLDLVAPQKVVALEVLDAVVRRHELPDPRLANVGEVLLGVVPGLRDAHLQQT